MKRMIAALLLAIAVSSPGSAATRARAPDGSHLLVNETVVDAPPADVWAAISTAEGWKSWAVPVAWASAADIIETSYSPAAKPGDPSTIRQQVLIRVPERLMVFRTVKAPERFPDFDTYSKVVSAFELEPVGEGRTRVRLTGTAYADSEAGRRLLGFFEKGNQASLDALKAHFAKLGAMPLLRGELEPLRFLIGHCWRGEFRSGSVDTHCFETAYHGQHVRDRHEVMGGEDSSYSGETLYSWDGSANRIGYTYWNSSGGVSRGTAKETPDGLDFGDETYIGANGRKIRVSTIWRKVGPDSYETVSRSATSPLDNRVVRYRRVD